MTPLSYNIALAVGTALIAVGVYLLAGIAHALVITGGFVILLTVVGACLGAARKAG